MVTPETMTQQKIQASFPFEAQAADHIVRSIRYTDCQDVINRFKSRRRLGWPEDLPMEYDDPIYLANLADLIFP
ncbi:MAG: hypothetical protein AABX82_02815, partial [Nanoarchaeota archaeon]